MTPHAIPLGVVTGFGAEAAIIRELLGPSAAVVCAGGRPMRAEALAGELIRGGARHLVSFGIAGGLAPEFTPGALVISHHVRDGETRHQGDADWAARIAAKLAASGLSPVMGMVAGAERAVTNPSEKLALFRSSGAIACDLESAGVARAARANGTPFVVLRAIADPAARTVPEAALVGLREDGSTDIAAVLAGLLRAPGEIVDLIGTALEARRALGVLRRASVSLGRSFGVV
ncbi:MAG: hypothetical protein FJX35_11365 [Alphaproteobacteria bacterium]|nr:hypothetical protein [Alphaproteobacteria bacterium]